jgi:hypothetical protein
MFIVKGAFIEARSCNLRHLTVTVQLRRKSFGGFLKKLGDDDKVKEIEKPKPPFAKQIPELIKFPENFPEDKCLPKYKVDLYSWMQDEEDPKLENIIAKENR